MRLYKPVLISGGSFIEYLAAQKSLTLKASFQKDELRRLVAGQSVKYLSIRTDGRNFVCPLGAADFKAALEVLPDITHVEFWCDTERSLINMAVGLQGLESLYILDITGSEKLKGFENALHLTNLNASHLEDEDVCAIAKAPNLERVSLHYADLSDEGLKAVLDLTVLSYLDLEGTNFRDEMAASFANTTTIETLYMAGTSLSRQGLAFLVKMKQLKLLDVWATKVKIEDLAMISVLPRLDTLHYGGWLTTKDKIDFDSFLATLQKMPKLKTLWLDGFPLNDSQKELLGSLYELSHNPPDED